MVFYKNTPVSVENTMLNFSFNDYVIIYLNHKEMFSNMESCVRLSI